MENTVLFHPITTSEFTFCWIYIVLMLFFLGYVFVSVQIWNSPKNMENMLYAIYISSIASGPFLIIFFLSLFLFFALFLLNLFGRIPVPTCLFVIALIFASIGLFAFAHLQSWQINVKQKSIEIHRLFKRTIHAESSETECCLTDSSKLNIYVDGKKVFKVKPLLLISQANQKEPHAKKSTGDIFIYIASCFLCFCNRGPVFAGLTLFRPGQSIR